MPAAKGSARTPLGPIKLRKNNWSVEQAARNVQTAYLPGNPVSVSINNILRWGPFPLLLHHLHRSFLQVYLVLQNKKNRLLNTIRQNWNFVLCTFDIESQRPWPVAPKCHSCSTHLINNGRLYSAHICPFTLWKPADRTLHYSCGGKKLVIIVLWDNCWQHGLDVNDCSL